jgi:class 3 adenylate cyclase
VEGSTRLLRRLCELYGDVRAEHDRLLREAFEANGGRAIDTQGDSFFVAFRRARNAVAAAVAAQRARSPGTGGRARRASFRHSRHFGWLGAGAREFPSARRTDIRCVGCR